MDPTVQIFAALARAESDMAHVRSDVGEIKASVAALVENVRALERDRARWIGYTAGACFAIGIVARALGV